MTEVMLMYLINILNRMQDMRFRIPINLFTATMLVENLS